MRASSSADFCDVRFGSRVERRVVAVVKVVVQDSKKEESPEPDIREIILPDNDEHFKLLWETAIFLYRANGLIFAIADWNDIASARLPTLVNKPLSKDPAELKRTIMKYARGIEIRVYVGSPAERSFIIGRKGSKIKKLARYLGIKIVVDLF